MRDSSLKEKDILCWPSWLYNENPVFNKIVGLKRFLGKKKITSWRKPKVNGEKKNQKTRSKKRASSRCCGTYEWIWKALFDRYTSELKLNNEVANILARDEFLSSFLKHH